MSISVSTSQAKGVVVDESISAQELDRAPDMGIQHEGLSDEQLESIAGGYEPSDKVRERLWTEAERLRV